MLVCDLAGCFRYSPGNPSLRPFVVNRQIRAVLNDIAFFHDRAHVKAPAATTEQEVKNLSTANFSEIHLRMDSFGIIRAFR